MREALPDIVIGGAPRSGTTFLATSLDQHPDVFLAKPVVPEPKVCLRPHPQGDDGYRAEYARLFSAAGATAVRIEKTTNYLEDDAARERLARVLVRARFLFILREPVARAVSNWKWSRHNGLETLPFAEAMALEGQRPNPLGPGREAARPFDYMRRGRYGTFARQWLETFGRERVRFILFEDMLRDPARMARDLEGWIGLPPSPQLVLASPATNATDDRSAVLDDRLAAQLRAAIRPEVEQFHRLTGLDIACWGYG